MRSSHAALILSTLAIAACSSHSARSEATDASVLTAPTTAAAARSAHDQGIEYGPAPAVFPPGAEMAVLQGDPSTSEMFTVRLRFPNGYKIPPHTHPTAENVTVIDGTFLAGMGSQFVETEMQTLGQGAFASLPAEQAHYAMARGITVVQVHAMGPFALSYVNPSDAPSNR